MGSRNLSITVDMIRKDVEKHRQQHLATLHEALKASFIGLEGFQKWIGKEMERIGMQVEEYQVDISELHNQPANHKTLRENPAALVKGPNVIGRLPGKGPGKGILLFGHADKRPETYAWGKRKPEMVSRDGKLYGPGIADDVCGLASMLAAVETFRRLGMEQEGDLLVASILGKQMGVFGTYGLMKRYGPVEAAIYVHPAESGDGLGDLKIASLGNLEFIITIDGKFPSTSEPHHTIFSREAVSASQKGIAVLQKLHAWAEEKNVQYRHARVEQLTGQSFSLEESLFTAGVGQPVYEIPIRCEIHGMICFPPNAKLEEVQKEFCGVFDNLVNEDEWLNRGHARLEFGDLIGDSCASDEDSEFVKMAVKAIHDVTGKNPSFYYGHSVSDIRYPLLYWNAQAFGVGPLCGDIGRETEWVDEQEYLDTIVAVTEMMKHSA